MARKAQMVMHIQELAVFQRPALERAAARHSDCNAESVRFMLVEVNNGHFSASAVLHHRKQYWARHT